MQDAQAGRSVIDCLLQYLDKGSHWTDASSLRNVAIGITRKVHYTLPLARSWTVSVILCTYARKHRHMGKVPDHRPGICVATVLTVPVCFQPQCRLCKHGDQPCPQHLSVWLPLQVCAEEHQRYLLFSSLLRHTSSSGMGSSQQVALVELATAEGTVLEGGLASPALVLAVKVCALTLTVMPLI